MINIFIISYPRLNTHKELYKSLKSAVETKDVYPTSAVDDHVGQLFLFDFEQCGIHLEEKHRQKVCCILFFCSFKNILTKLYLGCLSE